MRDVQIADDMTIPILAGATDEYVEEAIDWVRNTKGKDDRGWNQVTKRMSVLAIRGAMEVDPRKLTVLRRAEAKTGKKFLLPVARIESARIGTRGINLRAVESDSRIQYAADFADVCQTTAKRRYCIRVDGLDQSHKVSSIWQRHEDLSLDDLTAVTPEPLSQEWMDWTMVGVEIEMGGEAPKAINGARVIRAKALRLVLFNDSYIASLPIGARP